MVAAHLISKLSALLPYEARKFAIAFSGGGDSTALIHALKDHPRRGPVFIVDHNLRTESGTEALQAKEFAKACGYEASILKWNHNNPTTGLQAKARLARYGLLGQACRAQDIEHLLTAHSENDQAETLFMRYDKKTDWRGAAGMNEITHGPVWPQLAMVNVVRPLLGISRKALRAYNRNHQLTWIEDPSNQDHAYARIRARYYLSQNPQIKTDLLVTAKELRRGLQRETCKILGEAQQFVRLDRYGIIYLSAIPSSALLRALLQVAGGGGKVIDKHSVKRLRRNMFELDFKAGTLAGALIKPFKDGFYICRDLSAVKGRKDQNVGKMKAVSLSPFHIWDGRYILMCRDKNTSYDIASAYNYRADLSSQQRQVLRDVPGDARLTIPIINFSNMPSKLGPYESDEMSLKSIIRPRLEGLLGGELP